MIHGHSRWGNWHFPGKSGFCSCWNMVVRFIGSVSTHEAWYQLSHRNKLLCMVSGVAVGNWRPIRLSFSDLSFNFWCQVCLQKHISFSPAEWSLKNQTSFSINYQIFLPVKVFLILTKMEYNPTVPCSPHPTVQHPIHPTLRNESHRILKWTASLFQFSQRDLIVRTRKWTEAKGKTYPWGMSHCG